jgi:hypothetical protein
MPEPLESGDQVLIKDHDLAVQDQRGRWQGGDRIRSIGEAPRVIAAMPTDQPDVAPGLVDHEPPAVVLLLVHPALPRNARGTRVGCISAMEGRPTP